ncbi:glycosyltransferase family 61 protein [Fluviicola sp.]|uniref:glycosyltransferase family 61 protein n=1 Tax=Fluviicola sp. TaxID=1917219 RepID=UPI003D2D4414
MAQVEIIRLFPPAAPVDLKGIIDNDPPIHEAVEIHILKKARVNYYGYVFKNGRVYEHFVSPRHRGTITWKNSLSNYLKKKVVRFNSPVISIAHGWYDNYYHFTLEVLVKVFLLKDYLDDAVVLFPKKTSSFHRKWFEVIGLKNIRYIDENEVIVSPKVISCNFPNRDLNHHHLITPLFREWIIKQAQKKGFLEAAQFPPNLFIDRAKAAYRKILNHDEVEQLLTEAKIPMLNMEDLTLEEQINALYFAKHVSFVHGAGLTNILFCNPGTSIYDFCHNEFNQNCFYKLAIPLNLHYQLIKCKGNVVHESPGYCDLFLPLDSVREIIK